MLPEECAPVPAKVGLAKRALSAIFGEYFFPTVAIISLVGVLGSLAAYNMTPAVKPPDPAERQSVDLMAMYESEVLFEPLQDTTHHLTEGPSRGKGGGNKQRARAAKRHNTGTSVCLDIAVERNGSAGTSDSRLPICCPVAGHAMTSSTSPCTRVCARCGDHVLPDSVAPTCVLCKTELCERCSFTTPEASGDEKIFQIEEKVYGDPTRQVLLCPGKHQLMACITPHEGIVCDCCEFEMRRNQISARCHFCDIDICPHCQEFLVDAACVQAKDSYNDVLANEHDADPVWKPLADQLQASHITCSEDFLPLTGSTKLEVVSDPTDVFSFTIKRSDRAAALVDVKATPPPSPSPQPIPGVLLNEHPSLLARLDAWGISETDPPAVPTRVFSVPFGCCFPHTRSGLTTPGFPPPDYDPFHLHPNASNSVAILSLIHI